MRMISAFLAGGITAIGIIGCTRYVEYVPVEFVHDAGDHYLAENVDLATPQHLRAMVAVLKQYGEKYRLRDGRLYISVKLNRDEELLANYTQKALALQEGRPAESN